MRHVPCIENVQGDMRPCLRLGMSHSLVMYNRNHTCLVSSLFSVLVERLVSVVVKSVVLVNILPITKKNKCTVVTEAHKECTYAAQSRRFVRRKDASWSLNWPSGANLLAHKQHKSFGFVLVRVRVTLF